jgi:hypothetical protein
MKNHINIALLTVGLGICALTGPAAAQVVCSNPGTENVAGTCVTRGLAASMRLRGTIMNQLKIGYNYPMPPRLDNSYPKNFDVNRFEFSQPGNFSTNPFPPSP